MRFFKAIALALVATLSVTATTASATNYGWDVPPTAHPVNYHGQGHVHSDWGHFNNYSWYHVQGVASYDHLNVRHGPGVRNHVVYRLPFNGYGVQLHNCTVIATTRGPSRWCQISHQGYIRGWVNSRFLAQSH